MTTSELNRLTARAALALLAFFATASSAGAEKPDRQEIIAKADADGDGNVSWDEVTALRRDSFARMDRNGDGVVSADDSPPRFFAGRFNTALERLQTDFDGNRDGEITEDEMLSAPAPLFEQGDTDGDGILTAAEMASLRASAETL